MESKIEAWLDRLPGGVTVTRVRATPTENTYTWRVTFLDDARASNDFAIAKNAAALTADGGGTADISVTQTVAGETYASCTGTFDVGATAL
eukprot:3546668-Prorocentrum_lima.AAC.1